LFTTFRLYDNLRFETRKKKKPLDLVEITFVHQFGRVKTREGRTIATETESRVIATDTESRENCDRNRIKSNCNRHRIKRKLQRKQNQEQLQQKQNQELIATETESRRADSTRNRIKSDLQQKRSRDGEEVSQRERERERERIQCGIELVEPAILGLAPKSSELLLLALFLPHSSHPCLTPTHHHHLLPLFSLIKPPPKRESLESLSLFCPFLQKMDPRPSSSCYC
jgi:hypothetical protein